MKYRVGSMIIYKDKNSKEAVVLVTSKGRAGFVGTIPITNKQVYGYEYQVTAVVRY